MIASKRLSYLQAKAWACAQDPKIDGVKGWRELKRAGGLPQGMPAWPQGYYRTEFESWGEFLGTGTLAAIRRSFRTYAQTRAWARKLRPKITSKNQWYAMVKASGVPADIPTDPRSHYGEKFEGWGAFLGTGTIAPQLREMVSYKEAKQWVQTQTPVIYSREEYRKRQRECGRNDIPANPPRTYAGKFEGWPKFLGVRTIGSTSMIERMLKQELASFLPVRNCATTRLPAANGKHLQVDILVLDWSLAIEYDGARFHQGKEDQDRTKMSLLCQGNEGLRFVRVREEPLAKLTDLDVLVKPGLDPLTLTQQVVRHLLDVGMVEKGYRQAARSYLARKTMAGDVIVGARWRSYDKAREWATNQKLTTVGQWKAQSKVPGFLPPDIPANPKQVYGEQFSGWSDFLGVRIVAPQNRKFWSYERAHEWAEKRGITKCKQWNNLSVSGKLPKSLPSNPQATYKNQWRGWAEFLGTGKPADQQWAKLDEIARWCQDQSPRVDSFKQWEKVKDKPDFPNNFPKSLHYHFGKGAFERVRDRNV